MSAQEPELLLIKPPFGDNSEGFYVDVLYKAGYFIYKSGYLLYKPGYFYINLVMFYINLDILCINLVIVI